MRRAAWPTMALTGLALVGVLTVLVVSGSRSSNSRKFSLSVSPASQSVAVGATAQFQIELAAQDGFSGKVQLSTTTLPDGVSIAFTPSSVSLTKSAPSASAILIVTTSPTAINGQLGIGVIGRSGRTTETGSLSLRIDPTNISNGAPPPGPVTGTGGLDFAIVGSPEGLLKPGLTLPLGLVLGNPNPQRLDISQLSITIVSTSSPRCLANNFSVSQYHGQYPVSVPAGRRRSLADLDIPVSQWPQITMLNLATNQDGCKGVTVNLRYLGSSTGN